MANTSIYTFEGISQAFYRIDFFSGILFRKTSKLTWKEIFFRIETIMLPFCLLTLFVGTVYSKKYKNLLTFLILGTLLVNIITLGTLLFLILTNKEKILDLFDWCKKMYDVDRTYHLKIQDVARKGLRWLYRWSINLLKWLQIAFLSAGFFITLGITFIGFFLPENIYPTFLLPLPYFSPFKEQDNWTSYIISLIFQTNTTFVFLNVVIFGFSVTFLICLHIYGFMDIIEKAIIVAKEELEEKIIDHVIPHTKENVDELEIWFQLLTDMISDVMEKISDMDELFSFFLLLGEMSCYGGVFTFGLLMFVVKEQIVYGISFSCSIVSLVFMYCFISVALRDKFLSLSNALYEIPWYAMTPRKRSLLLTVLACREITMEFSAAGIHPVNLELFTKLIQSSYANCLVLKDLVTK